MLSSFIPFSELPKPIQDRAMALFISTYGMDITEAVALAYEEQQQTPRERRAAAYLARHGASFRQAKNGVLVPSESVEGTWYLIANGRCSCPARNGCKHLDAIAMWQEPQKQAA